MDGLPLTSPITIIWYQIDDWDCNHLLCLKCYTFIFWMLSSIAHFSTNPNTNAKTKFVTFPLTSPVTIICYQISNWDCIYSQHISDDVLFKCQFSLLVSQCIHIPVPCSLLEQHSLHKVASMTLIGHIINNSFIFIVRALPEYYWKPPWSMIPSCHSSS